MAKPKITARKHMGDDLYSWAVFVDGRPRVTGLSKREVPYWKARLAKDLAEKPALGGRCLRAELFRDCPRNHHWYRGEATHG